MVNLRRFKLKAKRAGYPTLKIDACNSITEVEDFCSNHQIEVAKNSGVVVEVKSEQKEI